MSMSYPPFVIMRTSVTPQLWVIIGYGVVFFSRSVGIYCRRTPPSINEGATIIIKIFPITVRHYGQADILLD